MKMLSNLTITVSFLFFLVVLFGCNSKSDDTEIFPPQNWVEFSEVSSPSFSLWLPADWRMLNSRTSVDVTGPTAFKPADNKNAAKVTVEFFDFTNNHAYEYTIEQDQYEALCSRKLNVRVFHRCVIGPYADTQFFLYSDPSDKTEVVLNFVVLPEIEDDYIPIWYDIVRSFIYEQPLTKP